MSKKKIGQEIRYVFTCGNESCGKSYEVYQPRSAKPKKKCPCCGKHSLYQEYSTNVWAYGIENAKTLGQLSDYNKKRVGKEQLDKMVDADPVLSKRKEAAKCENAPWWRSGKLKELGLPKVDKFPKLNVDNPKAVEKFIETGKVE